MLLGIALFLHRQDLGANSFLKSRVLLFQYLPRGHAIEGGIKAIFRGVLQTLFVVIDPEGHCGGQYSDGNNRFPRSSHLASFLQ
ncbi:hypothetical protein D3C87_1568850 [compost metagenome]